MKINRRSFMEWMGLAGGTTLSARWLGAEKARAGVPLTESLEMAMADVSTDRTSRTRWASGAQRKIEQTKDVTWLTHEPLDFVLRRGDHFVDEPARYARMVDPDNIKRMADAGVIWGRIFFYKGFGLEYEKPHMDQAKRAADLMHQLGMKVSLYIGGTMFTETFYRETPEAVNWEQRDQWNHWVPYGLQTYRHFACPNEPLYRDYLKRILKIGVQDLRADELAFDNTNLQPEPESCRCPRCIAAFGEFLRRRYPTSDAAMRRFGLADVDWIRLNQWGSYDQPDDVTELDDPVLQEWTRFRCETMAKYTGDLYDYVKSVNPNVAVLLNIKGIYSFNRCWTGAIYHPLFAGHIDLMAFDTLGYDAGINPVTGALVSQIRSYKVARRMETSCEDSFADDVRAAVHMAFGYQKPLGGLTAAPFGSGAFNIFTPMTEFFREYNERYYTETDNVADVAVLRNWPSTAYSVSAAYVPATLMEQVLIQYKVPFDLLFEEQLDRIGKYAAVILAGQECVSDAQVETLLRYARDGGTLVVAGNTGQYNEWREMREANPLQPAKSEGKGRIVYIPKIIPVDASLAVELPPGHDPHTGMVAPKATQMVPTQWVLPKNHEEIYKTIVAAMPGGLSISTEAPLTTVMELLARVKTNETIAHFVNFDRENEIAPFAVTLRKQFPGATKSVTRFSPEADQPVNLSFKESGGSVTFIVPAMRTYAMIVVAT
jgi:Beta-galactosidase